MASMAFCASSARAHGHETKAAGAVGHAIHHQVGFGDRAVRRKGVLQVVFGGIEGKISYKQFITHVMFYCPTNTALSTDCSRTPGLKSSLKQVHLRIYHALKETSYLTDTFIIALFVKIARTIGNYLLDQTPRPREMIFASAIYNGLSWAQDAGFLRRN